MGGKDRMLKSILEINKPLDLISLYWAVGLFLIGLFTLWCGRPIVTAMRYVKYPPEEWWRKKGYSPKELEDSMILYTRIFGVVWIACGLFWIRWVLYHQY